MNLKYEVGKISFIVPCYNGARFVKRFFNSLANQTYKNIQLILVNDGSTDETEQEVEKNSRILRESNIELTYLRQSNGGMGKAINVALKYIKGEFFTWFGIDDYPLPLYCEEAVMFLNQNQDFALVRIDGYYVSEHDESIIEGKVADCNHDRENPHIFWNAVTERNFQFGYSVLRTAIFEYENDGLDIYESYHGQNWQLLLPILYRHKSKLIDKPLYNVIVHQDSVSRVTQRDYNKRLPQLKEYINIIEATLQRMRYITEDDRKKAIQMTDERFAHKIYSLALSYSDFPTARYYYKYLKNNKFLRSGERRNYTNRYKRIEYWMYIKSVFLKKWELVLNMIKK